MYKTHYNSIKIACHIQIMALFEFQQNSHPQNTHNQMAYTFHLFGYFTFQDAISYAHEKHLIPHAFIKMPSHKLWSMISNYILIHNIIMYNFINSLESPHTNSVYCVLLCDLHNFLLKLSLFLTRTGKRSSSSNHNLILHCGT